MEPNHESQEAMAVQDPTNEQAIARRPTKKRRGIMLMGVMVYPERKRRGIMLMGVMVYPERKKSAIKQPGSSSGPPAPLPPPVVKTIENMKGSDAVFVARKILECSDVDASENRLFIPKSEVLWNSVLLEEEKRKVEAKEGLPVTVVDPRGDTHSLVLKKWWSLNTIVLIGGWRKVVKDNSLEAVKDCIELWGFRADDKLCFALNVNGQAQ